MLLTATIYAQNLPEIAVYITGEMGDNEKRILATSMLNAFVKSGNYTAAERPSAFLAQLESEWAQLPSGTLMDNSQISELGRTFNIGRVCIADATPALGEYHISARIVNTETSTVVSIGESHGPLRTMNDLTLFADELVRDMLGRQARPVLQPAPAVPVPTPVPPPVVGTPTPVSTPEPAPIVPAPPPAPIIPPGVKPVIGIYITSSGGGMAARAITPLVANGLTSALGGGGRFNTANRTNDINRLLGDPQGGNLSERQMKNIADQLGIHYLCIAKINFGAGGSFGLEVQLVNAAAGKTVTTVNLQNLDRKTIASSMLNIGRELLAALGDIGGGTAQAAGAVQTPAAALAGRGHQASGSAQTYKGREAERLNFYFTLRYILPVTPGAPKWAIGGETGYIWHNNFYLGIEGGGGGSSRNSTAGYGLNLGGVIDLSDDLQLALGGFLGFWGEESYRENIDGTSGGHEKIGFVGPSVKLRWRFAEFSYRLLIGPKHEYGYGHAGGGFINQFTSGFYFQW